MIDPQFLSLLACPACKTPVSQEGEWLRCATCSRRYPIREDIPIMLVEEAQQERQAA